MPVGRGWSSGDESLAVGQSSGGKPYGGGVVIQWWSNNGVLVLGSDGDD